MSDLRALAARVLNGEVPADTELRRARLEAIADASRGLRLTKAAVAGVLRGYRDGRWTEAGVCEWATVVRETDADWEDEDDDSIREALSRLSELGDLVDGEIS